VQVVLVSTYDLGHQPFGLASPARWLKEVGATVHCVDLAVRPFSTATDFLTQAQLIAVYLPMHTATRLALTIIERSKRLNPAAHFCAYGLYAPLNAAYLQQVGVQTILGGEFEQGLVDLYRSLLEQQPVELPAVSLQRQQFQVPDRSDLPSLTNYAQVELGEGGARLVGYTEASRGCKHSCRHCPIVPVYNGRFRIVQQEIVLADIQQQIDAGAQHITFGDPDFFNGPGHAIPLIEALHREYPDLTYDVTIKIEHLLKHKHLLPVLRDTGCLFVTSAVEAVDDHILSILDKGHTRADFIEVVTMFREVGLVLNPTFVTFTPWTTIKGYVELLATLDNLGLVEHVSPIQYAIRLLIPAGSKLLELAEVQELVRPFDKTALVYPWSHPDPRLDELYEQIFRLVKANQKSGESRRIHFERVWQAAVDWLSPEEVPVRSGVLADVAVPTLSESWY
jgi:radical SAM superfamily enzyme YgiQ (UPF0313 family)